MSQPHWHERHDFNVTYFDDLITAVRAHAIPTKDTTLSTYQQIAEWILDPIDQVLIPNATIPVGAELKQKAIQAFETCADFFPDAVGAHFREQAGTRAFRGLFNSADLDLYAMWCRIAKRSTSLWHTEETWLHKLASALVRDTELGDKMVEAQACCRLGLSRRETLAQIEEHHRQLGSHNTSAKSLLLLELL